MSKPSIHARSSAKRFGGVPEDYFPIHDLMDMTKGAVADNRHRVLTHNAWFLSNMLERIHFVNSGPVTPDGKFPTIINSDGKAVSVREIGEQHVLEDFRMRWIPSLQDYIEAMTLEDWMNNGMGDPPSSVKGVVEKRKDRVTASLKDGTIVVKTTGGDLEN